MVSGGSVVVLSLVFPGVRDDVVVYSVVVFLRVLLVQTSNDSP